MPSSVFAFLGSAKPSRRLFWRLATRFASLPLISPFLTLFSEWNRTSSSGFLFNPINPLVAHRYTKAYKVESLFTSYLVQHLTRNDVFYDIGACVGTFTFLSAKRCRHVVAIDASPLNISVLLSTLAINKFSNVTVVQALLLNSSLMHLTSIPFSGRFGVAEVSPHNLTTNDGVNLFLPSITPSTFFESQELLPTILKVDIDGYELDFFSGLSSKHLANVRAVLIEINEPAVTLLLQANGFTLLDRDGDNYIFFRK